MKIPVNINITTERLTDGGSYGADGICGAATVAAIKACQHANSLTADGICGPDTWGALLAK